MTDEVSLLKVLETRDGYLKYARQVSDNALSEEVQTLVADIGVWFDTDPKRSKVSWGEFDPWFRIVRHNGFSQDKKKYFRELFQRLSETEKTEPDKAIIERFRAVETATKVGDIAADVLQGHGDIALVDEVMGEYRAGRLQEEKTWTTPNIKDVLDKAIRSGGYKWRLKCLNDTLGNLRKGDFVIVGARPKTGKTSLIASELTYMAPQTEGRIVIFNNEEEENKIWLRLHQAATNKSSREILDSEGSADAEYAKALGGDPHKIVVIDRSTINVREVEYILREMRPSIITFNTLPKVHGFQDEKNDIKQLQKKAQWARELAKEYGPVLGVWQADAQAEGEKWLKASNLAWNKTDAVGEADAILMLGATYTPSERGIRFIHVVANKMDAMNGETQFNQHTVSFDGARARYGDM